MPLLFHSLSLFVLGIGGVFVFLSILILTTYITSFIIRKMVYGEGRTLRQYMSLIFRNKERETTSDPITARTHEEMLKASPIGHMNGKNKLSQHMKADIIHDIYTSKNRIHKGREKVLIQRP